MESSNQSKPCSSNPEQKTVPCCGPDDQTPSVDPAIKPRLDQPFVIDTLESKTGPVPVISSSLTWSDRFGSFKARWAINRLNYKVDPGLYALGQPEETSPVLVTANYRMSLDRLRQALPEMSAWILVLDTRGVNVWCAASKGTFGTEELIARLQGSGLHEVVTHRTLILPQLGAPGVAAHQIKSTCDFRAVYGPIEATDIPAFLAAGQKATPSMRLKSFTLSERAVLIPVELVGFAKVGLILALVFLFLSGLARPGNFTDHLRMHGLLSVTGLITAIVAGAVITPLLLPWLPGRAFAIKGAVAGLILTLVHAFSWWPSQFSLARSLEIGAWLFMGPALAAFIAMNFTGASTYTSLSGVKKEMRWAVPMEIGVAVLGLAIWIGSRFTV